MKNNFWNRTHNASSVYRLSGYLLLIAFFGLFSQANGQPGQRNFVRNQPIQNPLANSTAFKQEIARMEIMIHRAGHDPLPLSDVPRLNKNDVVKVRLSNEAINGLAPDQSNYDWSFLIAFVNPGLKQNGTKAVSKEVNFRKSGWYVEHAFLVPYDSQPIIFLYPKPKYRSKILKLIEKQQDDIQKIGEKTIEIADAYGKISMFLNELQTVVNRNSYYGGYGYGGYGGYNNYGYNNLNFGGGVHSRPPTSSYYGGYYQNNQNQLAEQVVERIAKSFNIQLPNCWNGGASGNYGARGGNYQNRVYNYPGNGLRNDFLGRIQCVARSVNIQDFDVSVAKMIQQGGVLLASQLALRYPQLAIWINVAALAIDFFAKLTNKAPLKIVPTIASSVGNFSPVKPGEQVKLRSGKVSLFAESQPRDSGFVTAYPIVFNKWQANADPENIALPLPVLMDSCLHVGQNVVRTTDIINDWTNDKYTKDFKFILKSSNGFQKKFDLKKNVGLGGWEMVLTKADLDSIPKIKMELTAHITGVRGFNQIKSSDFRVQLGAVDDWHIEQTSQRSFAVGGVRRITVRNPSGNCRCLSSVVYRPGFGGEFLIDSRKLEYSPDNKDVTFALDTTGFTANQGVLELRQLGGESKSLPLTLFGEPPSVRNVKLAKGDSKVILFGDRLEQINSVSINGKRAVPAKANSSGVSGVHTTTKQERKQRIRERTFFFPNSEVWTGPNRFSLELTLDGKRQMKFPAQFSVTSSRPRIVASRSNDIKGYAIGVDKTTSRKELGDLPLFPIEASNIGVNIQNALIDFEFKVERLRVEVRIENTPVDTFAPPDINFEVLDWRTMRLNISLSEATKRLIAGRRLQFRLYDIERGYSDWYTIDQTFVRTPKSLSLKCNRRECNLTGKGIGYIQSISLDNGRSWFPEASTALIPEPIGNGLEKIVIPNTPGKKVLRIKLRDYPAAEIGY